MRSCGWRLVGFSLLKTSTALKRFYWSGIQRASPTRTSLWPASTWRRFASCRPSPYTFFSVRWSSVNTFQPPADKLAGCSLPHPPQPQYQSCSRRCRKMRYQQRRTASQRSWQCAKQARSDESPARWHGSRSVPTHMSWGSLDDTGPRPTQPLTLYGSYTRLSIPRIQ